MTFRRTMAVFVILGILIAGVGTGIAFAEYSSMEYSGNVTLGEAQTETKTLIWEIGQEPRPELRPYLLFGVVEQAVELSTRVPRDEVWFEITYNGALGEPVLEELHSEWSEEENPRIRQAHLYFMHTDDLEYQIRLVMEGKDQLLRELKEGKFSTYEAKAVYRVRILINPKMEDCLRTEW